MKWFAVSADDEHIGLSVKPPFRRRWTAVIPWSSITRVCFEAHGPDLSDSLYIFTDIRPESWVIPTEAVGADRLWGEILRRQLFDVTLATEAASAVAGLFCWPPPP